MSIALSVPLAISAVKALLRYRQRVDTILSLKEATATLPFRLPPAPADPTPHFRRMLAFFRTQQGEAFLEVSGLTDSFKRVDEAARQADPLPAKELNDCYGLYFEAADVRPRLLAPDASEDQQRAMASSGPSSEMRLAYYVVESHRLSRNPALTRLLLATADTLLEFAGENASTFISNPRTRGIVETAIAEFAGRHDFDDDSSEDIFKKILGASLIAVLESPDVVPNEPAARAVLGALSDLREEYRTEHGVERGDELIARLITKDGFQDLVSGVVGHVAEDPSFLTSSELARKAVKATLTEFSQSFPQIADGDPKAMFAVIEAGIVVGAANVDPVLAKELGGRPLATAVLSAVASHIGEQASQRALFQSLATGDVFADIYRVALSAVAANPQALATESDVDRLASELVASLAGTLSETPLRDTFTPQTWRTVVAGSLDVAARHPASVARDHALAAKVISAVFAAAAPAVRDGLQREDVLVVLDAALEAASQNIALAGLEDRLSTVLESIGGALAEEGVRPLLTREGRTDALLAALQVVAANPAIWRDFDERGLVQPLVSGVLEGLATDPSRLLSGPVLVESMRLTLAAAARRGSEFLSAQGTTPNVLQRAIELALVKAQEQIGTSIDGENLPEYLERVVSTFLRAPVALDSGDSAEFDELIESILSAMELT